MKIRACTLCITVALVVVMIFSNESCRKHSDPNRVAVDFINSGEFDLAYTSIKNSSTVEEAGDLGHGSNLHLFKTATQSEGFVRYLLSEWVKADAGEFPGWAYWITVNGTLNFILPEEEVRSAHGLLTQKAKTSLSGFALENEMRRIDMLIGNFDSTDD